MLRLLHRQYGLVATGSTLVIMGAHWSAQQIFTWLGLIWRQRQWSQYNLIKPTCLHGKKKRFFLRCNYHLDLMLTWLLFRSDDVIFTNLTAEFWKHNVCSQRAGNPKPAGKCRCFCGGAFGFAFKQQLFFLCDDDNRDFNQGLFFSTKFHILLFCSTEMMSLSSSV